MCARQVFRKLLITLLLLAFLSTASYLFAASRGIQVVSKKGQPLYLYKDYHAIVIGISDYEHWPSLPNAVKDAEEVATKLKEAGFKVRLISNPDSRELKSTLTYIARQLGKEKNRALLLYFAGHGETTELADGTELGFIVPKDCPLQNVDPFGFDSKAVSMRDIETLALRVKSKHMLMLFDSCFSGSLFALARAAPTDITEKSAYPVRQFITAGGADETVPDRSIFKVCLFRGLEGEADYNRDNYVTGSELGMYLQTKVVNYTRGAQHPQYGKINNPYLDRGDFIFVPKGLKAEVSPAPKRDQLKKDKEKLELASIPRTVAKVSLRSEPKMISETELKNKQKKYDFFERNWNPSGSFDNDFLDNGDGTITDRATGLMWQKSGSSRTETLTRARKYVTKLNKDAFAEYSDWRLPTIEELASLVEREKGNGVHLDPIFDNKQKSCWSADTKRLSATPDFSGEYEGWVVEFAEGMIMRDRWSESKYIIGFYPQMEAKYHIRVVRPAK